MNSNGRTCSDRGFSVIIDYATRKVLISFDANSANMKHGEWLAAVQRRIGMAELNPQPYGGFDDLSSKARTKLLNCFYVQAWTKRDRCLEYFSYGKNMILERFEFEKFLRALEEGYSGPHGQGQHPVSISKPLPPARASSAPLLAYGHPALDGAAGDESTSSTPLPLLPSPGPTRSP
jgi:hypothetical protein